MPSVSNQGLSESINLARLTNGAHRHEENAAQRPTATKLLTFMMLAFAYPIYPFCGTNVHCGGWPRTFSLCEDQGHEQDYLDYRSYRCRPGDPFFPRPEIIGCP